MADKGTERRERERIPCSGVRMLYAKKGRLSSLLKGTPKKGKLLPVRNITPKGVLFLSREELSPGEELQMTIKLARHRSPVHVEGMIIWCGTGEGRYPYAVGVRFTKASRRSRDRLNRVGEIVERRDDKEWTAWRLRSKERKSRMWGSLNEH